MINIYNDDCMHYLATMEDHSIDCIFTDVPYKQEFHGRGMAQSRKNYLKIKEYGSDQNLDYSAFFDLCLQKLKAINFFTFCDKETKFDFIKMAKDKGFGYKELCFCKTSPTPFTNNQWLADVEYGIHIFKDLPVMGDYSTKRSWFTMANFREPNVNHPSPKRVSVIKKILENITLEGQLVVDPFSGSGTTAIACSDMKRNCIAIEKNYEFWQDSCFRLEEHQQQLSLF